MSGPGPGGSATRSGNWLISYGNEGQGAAAPQPLSPRTAAGVDHVVLGVAGPDPLIQGGGGGCSCPIALGAEVGAGGAS